MAVAVAGLALMAFNTIGIGFMPMSDVVFFGLAGVLWLLILTGRVSSISAPATRRSSPRLLVAAIVLLVLATVSSFQSWYPMDSTGVVLRLIYLTLLWFWILRCLSISRRAIAWLLQGWRWGVLIACAGALASNAGIVALGHENAENRQSAWSGHPNDLAGYITVAVPIFVLAAPRAVVWARRRAELRWMVTVGVVVFALATTGSMTGFVSAMAGVAAGGAALLLTRSSEARGIVHPLKVMATLVVVVIAVGALFSSDVPVIDRLTRLEEGDSSVEASVGTRGTLNERVINQFDELLVVGHGLDLAAQDELRGADAGIHNMYVKVLYEAGLIAAIALVALLVVALQMCWKLLVNMRATEIHPDIAALFGSAVAALTFALFQPMLFHRYFWLPFGLIQCVWAMRRAELRDGDPPAGGNDAVGHGRGAPVLAQVPGPRHTGAAS
jgi:O-Antigen ligase